MFKRNLSLMMSCLILFLLTVELLSAFPEAGEASDSPDIQSPDEVSLISIAHDPSVKNYDDEDEVYDLVKRALEQLNPGDPENPLSNLIEHGDVVVLKPNIVSRSGLDREGCTRTSVLRPIIDLAVKAGALKVVVAEGPARPYLEDEVFISANITELIEEMRLE